MAVDWELLERRIRYVREIDATRTQGGWVLEGPFLGERFDIVCGDVKIGHICASTHGHAMPGNGNRANAVAVCVIPELLALVRDLWAAISPQRLEDDHETTSNCEEPGSAQVQFELMTALEFDGKSKPGMLVSQEGATTERGQG